MRSEVDFFLLGIAGMSAICLTLVLLCLRCFGVIYPHFPQNKWYRQFNAVLFAHPKAVSVSVAIMLSCLFCGLLLAYANYYVSEWVTYSVLLFATYVGIIFSSHARTLHYSGYAIVRKNCCPAKLELHLIATSKNKVINILQRLGSTQKKDRTVREFNTALANISKLGFKIIYVASPNFRLISSAEKRFQRRFGREAVGEFAPPSLSRFQTLSFRWIFWGRVKVQKEQGRLLQKGFLLHIPPTSKHTEEI